MLWLIKKPQSLSISRGTGVLGTLQRALVLSLWTKLRRNPGFVSLHHCSSVTLCRSCEIVSVQPEDGVASVSTRQASNSSEAWLMVPSPLLGVSTTFLFFTGEELSLRQMGVGQAEENRDVEEHRDRSS